MTAVRLRDEEVRAIVDSCLSVFGASNVTRVSIYGSRTNLEMRGGDIDIWIELKSPPASSIRAAIEYRTELFRHLEDQKVDVTITGRVPESLDEESGAFYRVIERNLVTLWKNPDLPVS